MSNPDSGCFFNFLPHLYACLLHNKAQLLEVTNAPLFSVRENSGENVFLMSKCLIPKTNFVSSPKVKMTKTM